MINDNLQLDGELFHLYTLYAHIKLLISSGCLDSDTGTDYKA